jgi:ribonucleotide monophosphatase NagD (HAD superfamily)
MLVGVDFDGVIHDQKPLPGFKMGRPIKGAREALVRMKMRGDTVVIFTYRALRDTKHIADWLKYFEIPYDRISNIKENFDLIIDDKAVKFVTWEVL